MILYWVNMDDLVVEDLIGLKEEVGALKDIKFVYIHIAWLQIFLSFYVSFYIYLITQNAGDVFWNIGLATLALII